MAKNSNLLFIPSVVLQFAFFSFVFTGIGFLHEPSMMHGNQSAKLIFLMNVLPALLILQIILFITRPFQIKITLIDLLMLLYFLYLVFSRYFISAIHSLSLQFLELLSLAILYILIRSAGRTMSFLLLYAVMLSGALQAVYGLLQVFGHYPSLHPLFSITGGFFNPGPYSGFLVSSLPIGLSFLILKPTLKLPEYELLKRIKIPLVSKFNDLNRGNLPHPIISFLKTLFTTWIPLLCTLVICVALPATRSRAAWMAAAISAAWLLFLIYKPWFRHHYLHQKSRAIGFASILMLILIVMGVGVYYLKKDSADGRVLIWKVSVSMVRDAPLMGHGYEKFKGKYMTYQAQYFSKVNYTFSDAKLLADDNQYAFNDPLKALVETGTIGVLLLIVIAIFLFRQRHTEGSQKDEQQFMFRTARAGLISIVAFSMFSYPSEILPIKISMVLFIAILAGAGSQTVISVKNGHARSFSVIFTALCMMAAAYGTIQMKNLFSSNYKDWHKAFNMYNIGNYDAANHQYKKIYPYLSEDGSFLVNYGKSLSVAGHHAAAVEVLTKAAEYSNNSIVQTALGDSYMALGKYEDAEMVYLEAHYMVPGRFYPLYLLANLYMRTGKTDNAREIAEYLLQKDVKVPSTAITQIQREMRKLISDDKQSLKED